MLPVQHLGRSFSFTPNNLEITIAVFLLLLYMLVKPDFLIPGL